MRFSIFLLQTSHFVIFGLFVAECYCLKLLITPSAVLCLQQLTITVANRADNFTVYLVSHQNSFYTFTAFTVYTVQPVVKPVVQPV